MPKHVAVKNVPVLLTDQSRTFLQRWLNELPSHVWPIWSGTAIACGVGPHANPPEVAMDRSTINRQVRRIGESVGLEVSPERLQQTFRDTVHAEHQDLLATAHLVHLASLDSMARSLSRHQRWYRPRVGCPYSQAANPLAPEDVKRFWTAVRYWDKFAAARDQLFCSLFLMDGLSIAQVQAMKYSDVVEQHVVRRAVWLRAM